MRRVKRPSPEFAHALALAGVRETFEGARRASRRRPHQGRGRRLSRRACARTYRASIIARAITPPGYPRRFDARFLAVDACAIAHRQDGTVHAEAELVELVWMPIHQARRLGMPIITETVLEEFDKRLRAGFGRDLPDEGFVCDLL
jgi:hypothetical protein